jgi:hypothetical protein
MPPDLVFTKDIERLSEIPIHYLWPRRLAIGQCGSPCHVLLIVYIVIVFFWLHSFSSS